MAEGGHGSKARRMEEAVAALLDCRSVKEAAAAVGMHENTLLRWMSEPAFEAMYKDARRQVLNAAIGRLQGLVSVAVQTLHDVMVDGEAPSSSRVSAARATLETAIKLAEVQELAERLEAVEKQLDGGARRSA